MPFRTARFTYMALATLVISTSLSACTQDDGSEGVEQLASLVQIRAPGTYNEQLLAVAELAPEFGGLLYNENGVLTAYVLDPTSSTQKDNARLAILAVFGEDMLVNGVLSQEKPSPELISSPRIEYLKSSYSYSNLYNWYRKVDALFDIPEVVYTDLDEAHNRLSVGVNALEAFSKVRTKVDDLGIPTEAIEITLEGAPEMGAELDGYKRPVFGGLEVSNTYQSDGGCTVGFNAVRNGIKGFVVNSHCTSRMWEPDNIQMYQDSVSSSERVGVETFDPLYSMCGSKACRYSDAAFVDYADALNPP